MPVAAVLITSIPFANHYDNSFTLNTKNNITEKYNGTAHYIIQGRYYSAFLSFSKFSLNIDEYMME